MNSDGVAVEFSAIEKDSGAVVAKVSETPSIRFDVLDFGVNAFTESIGDRMLDVGDDVLEMSFDHLGDSDDGFELATTGPPEPFFEKAPGRFFIVVGPE